MATDERRRFVLAACLRAVALGIAHTSDSGPATQTALTVSQGLNTVTRSLVGLAELFEARRLTGWGRGRGMCTVSVICMAPS